jgi:hypothetical protein
MDLLGEIVTWDIPGTEVEAKVMRAAIQAAGLGNPDELVSDLKTKSAFTRAMKSLKDKRLIEKVKAKGGIIKFQLTQESNNGDRIEHVYEAILELDTTTGVVTSQDDPKLAAQAATLVQHAMAHRNAGDINRVVQMLFAKNGDLFPINPKKGTAYYVPNQHLLFTDRVQVFMEKMGGQLIRFPVPSGTANGNASVAQTIEHGVERMILELDETIDGFDDKTRHDTVERVQARVDQIKFKMQAYQDCFSGASDRLAEQLSTAQQRLAERVLADEAKAEQQKALKVAERSAKKAAKKQEAVVA